MGTPGTSTQLTITDPLQAAKFLLQAKDKGTASGELPVSSRKAEFWVKQTKAPPATPSATVPYGHRRPRRPR